MMFTARRIAVDLWGCAAAFALCMPAFAISPDLEAWQLYHTSWIARDGAPVGIQALTQTSDGYLWLGTYSGLFRFDGVRFERSDRFSDSRLPSTNIYALFAAPAGELWIGYAFGGVSVVKNRHISSYSERDGVPSATVYNIIQDTTGITWAATTRGLLRFDGQHWVNTSQEWNGPKGKTSSLAVDGSGTLWVLASDSVFYLSRGATQFGQVHFRLSNFDIGAIHVAPDGTPWLFTNENRPIPLGIADNVANPPESPPLWLGKFDSIDSVLIDREGGLWLQIGKIMRHIKLASDPLRHAANEPPPGLVETLSSDLILCAFEDREGNAWFGTAGGLDKFREPRLQKIELPGKNGPVALSDGEMNTMWAVSPYYHQLVRFGSGVQPELIENPPHSVTALHRDPVGALWLGGSGALWRRGPSESRLSGPFGNSSVLKGNDVQSIITDGSGALWVSVVRTGVFRIDKGDVWTLWGGRVDLPQEPATILAADARGPLWLGYTQNRVVRLNGNNAVKYSAESGLDLGTVLAFDARRRNVWVGGEHGLARFDGRAFLAVTGESGRPFTSVTGIVETTSGDLWLNTGEGAVHIPAAEVRQVIADPNRPVRYDLLNYLDGMPGTPQSVRPLPTLAESADGQLWFSTSNGVARIDPLRIKRNDLKPNVVIQSVTADGVRHEFSKDLLLQSNPRNLEIVYTALSLSIPERVQFRYLLDGVDASWQNVGTRRVAYYTDLKPGHYQFRVVASNNDNVWNEVGATVRLIIPPTFVQTRWFQAFCALAVAVLIWLLFRLRLRQISAAHGAQLEARIIERERIARELHDTFLQGVQGLMLRFQSAMEKIPESQPARQLMNEALKRADDVLNEGRDRVSELRKSAIADLSRALQEKGAELAQTFGIKFYLTVEGKVRPLRSSIAEELQQIGGEALTNAFRHSHAERIDAQILYGADSVSLRVSDNGTGFDVAAWNDGLQREHWGLLGMRERAHKIRAQFEVTSRPGLGTAVKLRVPGSIAFEKYVNYFRRWLWQVLGKGQDL